MPGFTRPERVGVELCVTATTDPDRDSDSTVTLELDDP